VQLERCLVGLVVDVHLIHHLFVRFELCVGGLLEPCHCVLTTAVNVSYNFCEFVLD
jgi:hypothetical protein